MKSKQKIKVDAPVYYFDHRGRPQRTFCIGKQTQANWDMYELSGVPSFKFESEVFASKADMIAFIKAELNELK